MSNLNAAWPGHGVDGLGNQSEAIPFLEPGKENAVNMLIKLCAENSDVHLLCLGKILFIQIFNFRTFD